MTGNWQADALCAQTDPEIFAPDVYNQATTREAKAICGRCPARVDCLEGALDEEGNDPIPLRGSVRGGKNPRERHAIAQRRRRPAAA
ncbi:WhiB family transcriptional regulator [Streptomyces nigrescens]